MEFPVPIRTKFKACQGRLFLIRYASVWKTCCYPQDLSTVHTYGLVIWLPYYDRKELSLLGCQYTLDKRLRADAPAHE